MEAFASLEEENSSNNEDFLQVPDSSSPEEDSQKPPADLIVPGSQNQVTFPEGIPETTQQDSSQESYLTDHFVQA